MFEWMHRELHKMFSTDRKNVCAEWLQRTGSVGLKDREREGGRFVNRLEITRILKSGRHPSVCVTWHEDYPASLGVQLDTRGLTLDTLTDLPSRPCNTSVDTEGGYYDRSGQRHKQKFAHTCTLLENIVCVVTAWPAKWKPLEMFKYTLSQQQSKLMLSHVFIKQSSSDILIIFCKL